MASTQSPEASEIRRRGRQRLIGAVAIALLLIVFVPMLLDSEPRSARDEPKLDIPPKDKAPPLPAPTGSPEARVAPPTPAMAAATPSPAAPTPAPSEPPKPAPKVATVEPKAVPAPAPKAAAATPAKEGFAVQVGAFHDDAKLKQVREKLTAAKIASYTEPAGELTRLRVGPFPTREAADKSAAAVRKVVPDAKVIPLS
jgi:DedD protein